MIYYCKSFFSQITSQQTYMQVVLQEKSGVLWMDVFIYTSSFNFILLTGCQDIKIKTGEILNDLVTSFSFFM